MKSVTAVFDIGKTNKKLLLYDENFEIVRENQIQLAEREDDDGFLGESLPDLKIWLKTSWEEIEKDKTISIKSVNFTTYGASFVHLDSNNQVVTPLYNYLKPYPDSILEDFYQKHGNSIDFASLTASPSLGMLNSGLQIFWLKYHKPHLFRQIRTSLHFPQYCAYLFSGKLNTEMTSIGCHTGLWDFSKKDYHTWVYQEGIDGLLPPITTNYTDGFAKFRNELIPCGVGLHDSSAALIPYKSLTQESFILLSTGTWGITLNPFAQYALTPKELKQDCLYYLTFEGQPVRASRFFLGNLHEKQIEKLSSFFHTEKDFYKTVRFDNHLIEEINFYATVFDESDLSQYPNYQYAYHLLINTLATKQVEAVCLAIGDSSPQVMFIDGGFAKNRIFMEIMRLHFPNLDIQQKSFAQGTSLGAAMVVNG